MDLTLHAHDDIELLYPIYPISLIQKEYKYIMQQNRIVHVGNVQSCISFLKNNEGKFCKQLELIKNH